MCRPFVAAIALVLLNATCQAQEPEDPGQSARFQPAQTVSVTEVHNGDQILGIAGGTVVLEVKVNHTGKIEDMAARRDIESLTPHVMRWVRTWTFKPAKLDGNGVASTLTVAVTVNPATYPPMSLPLPPLKEATDQGGASSQFQPPQVVFATFPKYPFNTVISDTVALEVTISETGKAGTVKVLRDIAPLTPAAIDAVRDWKFEPATLHGKPVEAQITLAFVYRSPDTNFP